jgi:hypothetical protein
VSAPAQLSLFDYTVRFGYIGDRLHRADYAVLPIERPTALSLVRQYHYAGGGSLTGVYFHGLFRRDNLADCLGCAWWLPPMKGAAQMVSKTEWRKVLGLHRFVVADGVPKNAATFLLGGSIRAIRQEGRFLGLLTYADEGQGHKGTIYRASNWAYLGASSTRHATWTDPESGGQVSIKRGPHTRTYAEMEALGYVRGAASIKHRFAIRPASEAPGEGIGQ